MKRNFLSTVQAVLLVGLACAAIAIGGRLFPLTSDRTVRAAPFDVVPGRYANVIVVAKSGGDFNVIQKALNSIGDNSPSNRYLVWVAPGVYTETITLKQYVDIEGAGELITKITYPGSQDPGMATVRGWVNDVELRNLTVENTGGSYYAKAIWIYGSSPRFNHITAVASGASGDNDAFQTGTGGSPTLRNVTAIALGGTNTYGINSVGTNGGTASLGLTDTLVTASGGSYSNHAMYNFATSPTIWNSKLSASGGTVNYAVENYAYYGSYSLTIDNSTLIGSTSTLSNHALFLTHVGASKLEGGSALPNGGTLTCAGVYDENYVFFPNTCP
jgi:hypothetical protein